MKSIVAGLVLLTGSITATNAKTRMIYFASIPPVQYDQPYTGKLAIQRFSVRDKIPCKTLLACAYHATDSSWCYIAMAIYKLLATENHTSATEMRHELGHCNGWIGHAGERLVLRDNVKAPVLTDRLYLPTDDLSSVCIASDGSAKLCEPNDKWTICSTSEGKIQPCKRLTPPPNPPIPWMVYPGST